MPQIGPLEILVVLVIALLVFGPDKLPGMAKQVGRVAHELKRMASEVKSEFEEGLEVPDDDDDSPGEADAADTEPASPDEAVTAQAPQQAPDDKPPSA